MNGLEADIGAVGAIVRPDRVRRDVPRAELGRPVLAALVESRSEVDEILARCERLGASGRHREGADQADAVLRRPDITPLQQARGREMLAVHRMRLGDFAAAVQNGLQALEYLDAQGDLLRQSRVHCTLALAYTESALNEPALRHVLAALEAARACGNRTAEFWALSRSSMVHAAMGDAPRGVELGCLALSIARSVDDEEAIFASHNNLGDTYLEVARGRRAEGLSTASVLQQALTHVRDAVAYAQLLGHTFYESMARTNLVSILIELEHLGEASQQVARAKDLARTNGYRNLEVNNDAQLAAIVRAQGNFAEATAMMQVQLANPSSEDDPVLLVTLHRALYEMNKASGRFEQALHHHEQLLAITARITQQTAGLQSKMLINTMEIEQARHEAERSRMEARMERVRAEELVAAAQTDPLTGLPNRRALHQELPLLMSRSRDSAQPLCAAMIDFDHFKQVNDQHGHATGDQVLITMAGILRDVTRDTDLTVRMGGEEFLLVFADTTAERAQQACDRMLNTVRGYNWESLAAGLTCTVSAGVARWNPDETTVEWLARTDDALYAAKAAGRDLVVVDAG